MGHIELKQAEMSMLREVLQTHLSELTFEIAFTHTTDSVKFLKKRKEFIEELIQRLEAEMEPGEKDAAGPDQAERSVSPGA